MHCYRCYGLGIESELALPLPESELSDLPCVSIRIGGCERLEPRRPLPYDAGGAAYGPCNGGILVRAGRYAEFSLTEGSILVSGRGEESVLGDLIVRMALVFLLQLRSALAFHGSAVSRGGKTIAFFGNCGAGKSTTALGLVNRGWGLLCDDTVVVGPGGLVPFSAARTRLNRDAYSRIAGGSANAAEEPGPDGKYAYDPRMMGADARLDRVFILSAREVENVKIREIKGYAKLASVSPHLLSPRGIGDPGDRLLRTGEALARVPTYEVSRPMNRFALDELLDLIETENAKVDK
jgi:hypothetical protein